MDTSRQQKKQPRRNRARHIAALMDGILELRWDVGGLVNRSGKTLEWADIHGAERVVVRPVETDTRGNAWVFVDVIGKKMARSFVVKLPSNCDAKTAILHRHSIVEGLSNGIRTANAVNG